jgi:geranylgeranyl pyrophosphate synthase
MAVGGLRRAAADEVRDLLAAHTAAFPAAGWLEQALSTPGKLLSDEEDGWIWGMAPVLACQSVGGDPRLALPAAAAVDCLIAATDVLDDIEDASDGLWRRCGLATATNVATLLLFLSQAALGRLVALGSPVERVASVGQALAEAGVRACRGQQADLAPPAEQPADEAAYLALIDLKAGALVAAICRVGAALGGAPPETLDAFATAGLHMGRALQIGNDVAGLRVNDPERNDLVAGKRTLPLIFALSCGQPDERAEIADLWRMAAEGRMRPADMERAIHLLDAGGALAYAQTVADLSWERAVGILRRAVGDRPSPLSELVGRLGGVYGDATA